MNITKAKYQSNPLGDNQNTHIEITVDNQIWVVPVNEDNRHYRAILEWVKEGNKIEEAD
tara:strand:- start:84 stop:260 length:177 start_codon:yes stop_codon:yes gene_type:complete